MPLSSRRILAKEGAAFEFAGPVDGRLQFGLGQAQFS